MKSFHSDRPIARDVGGGLDLVAAAVVAEEGGEHLPLGQAALGRIFGAELRDRPAATSRAGIWPEPIQPEP